VLSSEEIHSFWKGLDDANMSELSRLALKLQLVTAQRKGEIVSSEWEEFDLANGWWTIPTHKAKNGNTHRVPLSKLALELLRQIKTVSGNYSPPPVATNISPQKRLIILSEETGMLLKTQNILLLTI